MNIGDLTCHHAAKNIDLVTARCRDEKIRIQYTCFLQDVHGSAAALYGHDIRRLLALLKHARVPVDDNDVMPVHSKSFCESKAYFSVPDNDDLHYFSVTPQSKNINESEYC